MSIFIREASINDWDRLKAFFLKIYRFNHPLQNKNFWEWQYGYPQFGRSFICLNNENEIVGHVGATFGGGIAWIINVYLNEQYRGRGILGKLYDLARRYYPLAATAANSAGLRLYRNMRWIRYYDLVRYVKINPSIKYSNVFNVCKNVNVIVGEQVIKDTHYFKQPSIIGVQLKEGSRGISQEKVGGFRVVDINDHQLLEDEVWQLGYLWMDYITSWNDFKINELEKSGWNLDYKSIVPWRLNPLQEDYFSDVTFLSEQPLDKEFIVHRSYSDHGRVGSL